MTEKEQEKFKADFMSALTKILEDNINQRLTVELATGILNCIGAKVNAKTSNV